MKFILALLLAMAMTVNAFAAVTAQSRVCCESEQCAAIQCADMGCLPAANALAPQGSVAFIAQAGPRELAIESNRHIANRYKEVWTPPD